MKISQIIVVVLISCVIVSTGGAILFYNLSKENNNTKVKSAAQEVVPIKNADGTETIYGMTMRKDCSEKFQNFIKNYGADYSKCLVPFSFNEAYCGGYNPDTQGLSNINIIVILDSSGSMAQTIGSERKIDIAKKTISDFLAKMPPGVNTGLIVYGHKGSGSGDNKSVSCAGVEEVVKLGANNSSKIVSAMNSFEPKGWTPIAGSFDFAKNVFKSGGENNKNYLVLVSDGIESCDGAPLASAENLKLEIKGIKLNIIGFTEDAATKIFLQKVATKGNGTYLTAQNSSDMVKAFSDQLSLIKKECFNVTVLNAAAANSNNNLNNLNCWLNLYKKEAADFSANMPTDIVNGVCNQEIFNAVQARYTSFWYQKQDLEEKNNAVYQKIKDDLKGQLKNLK